MKHRSLVGGMFVLAALLSACTMKKQEAPDFTGPSEFGTSVVVSISPDVLPQDGASQSVVTVTARGPNGQPVANLALRAEIRVNGTPMDFGSLSARSIVTGSDGKATFVYTAPTSLGVAVDPFTIVDIVVTPVGSDFNNSAQRSASVRLVHNGPVAPADGLAPYFTFSPTNPQDHQVVLFSACNDPQRPCAPANNPIFTYSWNFGDGRTATGQSVAHDYFSPGTYLVQLTVTDGYGRSATSSQTMSVGAGVNPTAVITFSPQDPLPGTTVQFNALSSRAAPGRTIVSYSWDFGDGTSGSGVQTSHLYPNIGNFNVTLVVTDDVGRTGVATQVIPVQIPDEEGVAPARKKR
ncbi:MAG: PKD domain-containing protein [Vicinamibacterales bacterium]|jgi:chitodextrinase